MKIIALYGPANTGKSTTLKLVAENLKKSLNQTGNPVAIANDDYRYTFTLPKGDMVCITTAGDNDIIQIDNADYALKQSADIWVTASHVKDSSIGPVMNLAQAGHAPYVIWVEKLRALINKQDTNYKNNYGVDQPKLFFETISDRMNHIDADRILNLIY